MCAKVSVKKTPSTTPTTSSPKEKVAKVAKNRISQGGKKTPTKPKRQLYVVKINCLPFGFFENELAAFFHQFGTIIRVRVARSPKSGNHRGWAFVGFDHKDVAEIAAETMDGYLMFDHKLRCTVLKPSDIPKSMLTGPMILPRPSMKGQAKRDAMNRFKAVQTDEKIQKKKAEVTSRLGKALKKAAELGVDYEFVGVTKKQTEPDNDVQVVEEPVAVVDSSKTKTKSAPKTPKAQKKTTLKPKKK